MEDYLKTFPKIFFDHKVERYDTSKEELDSQDRKWVSISAALGHSESVNFSTIWGDVLALYEYGHNIEDRAATINKSFLGYENGLERASAETATSTAMSRKTTPKIFTWQGVMGYSQHSNLIQEAQTPTLFHPCTNKILQFLVKDKRERVTETQAQGDMTGSITDKFRT